jgi:hypothetical protein
LQAPDLAGSAKRTPREPRPSKHLQGLGEIVYAEVLEGTDLRVEVSVASLEPELAEQVRRALLGSESL